MQNNDQLLTNAEAATYLGFKPYTLKRARKDNKLSGKEPPKCTKIGTTIRYKRSDLDAWVNGDIELSVDQ